MSDRLFNLMVSRAQKAKAKPWEPQAPVEGKVYCNICCGGRDKSGEDFLVAVGFGSADVSASGAHIISEQEWIDADEYEGEEVTLSLVERVAKVRPELDWRIHMHGPLSGQEYQRHGDGRWALVHRDEGFA